MLTIAGWLVLTGLIAVVVDTMPARAAASDACRARADTDQFQDAYSALGEFDRPGRGLQLTFGESREPGSDFVRFPAWSEGQTPRAIDVYLDAPLARSDGRVIQEGKGLTVAAVVQKRASQFKPAWVRVCVAVDPRAISQLRPGRYGGEVVLNAENFRDMRIPLTVTFRAPRDHAIGFAVAGVLIGLIVKILTELGAGQRSGNRGARHELRSYVFQWSFPLTIILGVLAGWLSFLQLYDANPTWGVDGADSLKLFGMCFGFQMGSIGGADLAKRLVG